MRLASLEAGVASDSGFEDEEPWSEAAALSRLRAYFNGASFDRRSPSFEERFTGLAPSGSLYAAEDDEPDDSVFLLPPDPRSPAARLETGQSAADAVSVVPVTPAPRVAAPRKRVRTAEAPKDPLSDVDGRTAIYDISAHTVYLPNGKRLEAHSGLGGRMDDIRYVNVRMEGPTPPNVYDLTLREQLFHGVRAIRLNPVGDGNMYGRAGILAHTYMLGPNGQSNGCVSFRDYQAFLNAYLNGEINRIVVVERLETEPASKTASDWIPEAVKAFFRRS